MCSVQCDDRLSISAEHSRGRFFSAAKKKTITSKKEKVGIPSLSLYLFHSYASKFKLNWTLLTLILFSLFFFFLFYYINNFLLFFFFLFSFLFLLLISIPFSSFFFLSLFLLSFFCCYSSFIFICFFEYFRLEDSLIELKKAAPGLKSKAL